MLYKQIKYLVKNEDIKTNSINSYTFVLEPEDRSIILGTIKLNDGTFADGFGVCLEEIDKITNISIDKCFTFADEKGNYCLCFTPIENKIYNIVIYRFIK